MSRSNELQRFGVKLYLEPGTVPPAAALIPIFHRWIRDRSLDGLLIDVADYRHLVDGPRVLLVGHEGNLAVDEDRDRVGLLYTAKRTPGDSFEARLTEVARRLLTAAQLLEEDETLAPSPRFDTSRLEIFSNDRLRASSDEDSAGSLRPALEALAAALHPGGTPEVGVTADSGRERLRLSVSSGDRSPISVLLDRLPPVESAQIGTK